MFWRTQVMRAGNQLLAPMRLREIIHIQSSHDTMMGMARTRPSLRGKTSAYTLGGGDPPLAPYIQEDHLMSIYEVTAQVLQLTTTTTTTTITITITAITTTTTTTITTTTTTTTTTTSTTNYYY